MTTDKVKINDLGIIIVLVNKRMPRSTKLLIIVEVSEYITQLLLKNKYFMLIWIVSLTTLKGYVNYNDIIKDNELNLEAQARKNFLMALSQRFSLRLNRATNTNYWIL